MTTDMQLPERQRLIVDHVNSHGRVTVDALAASMSISRETIRRDLAALAGKGLIFKFHGGARPVDAPRRERSGEEPFQARMSENVEPKRRIAAAAAALFKSGDTLFVDTGTTTVFLAEELGRRSGLSLITNSCAIADHVSRGEGARVFLIGGEYRAGAAENVGRLAIEQIRTLKAEHVVLTVGALDVDGVFDFDLQEAEVAREMIARARRLTVVLDASKLGKAAIFQVCPLDRLERVVVDQSPPSPIAEALADANVDVIVAK
jgi:DeoR family glycerol-3-phosphate regulon repressor